MRLFLMLTFRTALAAALMVPAAGRATADEPAPSGMARLPEAFGGALDAGEFSATVDRNAAFVALPLTVECWAKVAAKTGFNVFVSNDPKTSGNHWELYSFAETGVLSVYMPGFEGGNIKSDRDVCDGRWHYLAMRFDGKTVRLFVDGNEVHRADVAQRPGAVRIAGPLAIGRAYTDDHEVGCAGQIDEVRVSKTLRTIEGVPAEPFVADGDTIGLWHFDEDPRRLRSKDASSLRNSAEYHMNF